MAPVMNTAAAAERSWAQVAHKDASSGEPKALRPGARGERTCPCHGEVIVMLGHYGWILVQEAIIDHEDSERNGAGRVYLAAKDVKSGARLREGDQVAFFLYADGHGLGAEECSPVPRKAPPPPGFTPPELDDRAEFPKLGGDQKGGLHSDAPAFQPPSAAQLKDGGRDDGGMRSDAPVFQPAAAPADHSSLADHGLRSDAPVFQPLAARTEVDSPMRAVNPLLAAWLEDSDSEDEDGDVGHVNDGLRADAPVFEPAAVKPVDGLRPDAPVFQPSAAKPEVAPPMRFINPTWLEDSDSEDESEGGDSGAAADESGGEDTEEDTEESRDAPPRANFDPKLVAMKACVEVPSRSACRVASPDAATSAGDTSSGSEEDFAETLGWGLPATFRPPPGLPPPGFRPPPGLQQHMPVLA